MKKQRFRLAFNGKAQSGIEVKIVREGVRYRNDPKSIKLITDRKGFVSFTLKN